MRNRGIEIKKEKSKQRTLCVEKEECRKIKRKTRGVGMGNVCGGDKSREKKKEKKCTDARK